MSKLGEMIRRATRAEATPMGFAAAAERKRAPTVLVLVKLGTAAAKKASDAVANGADGVIIAADSVAGAVDALRTAVEGTGGAPCGLLVPALDADDARQARQAGADFVIFDDAQTDAAALLEEGPGYVLGASEGMSDTYLRTVDATPVEALYVWEWGGPLTVRRQLELARLATLSRRPLLVNFEAPDEEIRLRTLRDAGVAAVVLEGSDAVARAGGVKELVERLPAARRRRGERPEAVLPRVAAAEEEEEDEEDRL